MIDSHCHLADEAFAADLEAVVTRAREAGLTSALCILAADDPAELARAPVVGAAWPGIRFATAVHPHRAGAFAGRAADAAATTAQAISRVGAVALGELGLDYHYDLAPRETQREVLAAQIDLAVERDLPIVVHTREAMADTVAVIRDAGRDRARGVIHCFTGTVNDARVALDLGFFLSFAGILTFPRAEDLRAAAALVPLDRLLVETDAPYLAPVPHRGKRNEPAWAALTLARLAAVKGVPEAAMASAVRENFERLLAPRGTGAPSGIGST
jgi:TatD DNase family protein